jgi:hypothetical protein
MSGELKVMAAAAALLLVVGVAMCVGLSHHDPAPQRPRAGVEDDSAQAPEPEPSEEPAELTVAEEPAPVASGQRVLHGTVTDAREEPLAGVEVMVDGHGRLRDITNQEGYYELRAVPSTEGILLVHATGYADEHVKLGVGRPGSRERIDVELRGGSNVGGVVVGPDGAPITGAQVTCLNRADGGLSTETDRYGRFELPTPAVGCDGVARHGDHGNSLAVVLAAGADNVIALSRRGSVRGVVVDGQGRPVPSFVVTLEELTPEGDSSGRRRYQQSFSSPQGRFSVTDLGAGTYVFAVRTPDGQLARTPEIHLATGEQVRGLRVTLP